MFFYFYLFLFFILIKLLVYFNLSAGLTFFAISQVKTLKGLAFHTCFDHAQLM